MFVNAEDIGYEGTAGAARGHQHRSRGLARFEQIRIAGALRMGLIKTAEEAATRQHRQYSPFVAPAKDYLTPAAWR